jgi:hypothetical protein
MAEEDKAVTWRFRRALILSTAAASILGLVFGGVWITSSHSPSALGWFGPIPFVWLATFIFAVLADNSDKF